MRVVCFKCKTCLFSPFGCMWKCSLPAIHTLTTRDTTPNYWAGLISVIVLSTNQNAPCITQRRGSEFGGWQAGLWWRCWYIGGVDVIRGEITKPAEQIWLSEPAEERKSVCRSGTSSCSESGKPRIAPPVRRSHSNLRPDFSRRIGAHGAPVRPAVAAPARSAPHQESARLVAPSPPPEPQRQLVGAGGGGAAPACGSVDGLPEEVRAEPRERQPRRQPPGAVVGGRQSSWEVAGARRADGGRGRAQLHGHREPGGVVHGRRCVLRQRLRSSR